MKPHESLSVLAGQHALQQLKDGGLDVGRIAGMVGAAGGPKWLILHGLDRVLFGQVFANTQRVRFLLGSSIGAWRFAALAQAQPLDALERFRSAYMAQRYPQRPHAAQVSQESWRVMDGYLDDAGTHQILESPCWRLNILSVRSRQALSSDSPPALWPGMLLAAVANFVARPLLGLFFERVLFHDRRSRPALSDPRPFPTRTVPLTPANLRPALMASGSIPLVMQGVRGLAQAPAGTYRDGGILDYHPDLRLGVGENEWVLFAHFGERVVPGWLDKHYAWRRPGAQRMSQVVLIAPSPAFVASLPFGKIPDRKDFWLFAGRDAERLAYWHTVLERGRQLGQALLELLESGRIKEVVRPLQTDANAKVRCRER